MPDVQIDLAILLQFPGAKSDRGYPAESFWTGQGSLRIGDTVYEGINQVLGISPVESVVGEPSSRLEITIAAVDETTREAASRDIGYTEAELRFARKVNNNWVLIPRIVKGVISEPKLTETTYTVTLETQTGYRPNKRINFWSHTSMRERVNDYGGATNAFDFFGLEYMAQLEQGLVNIDWPPN